MEAALAAQWQVGLFGGVFARPLADLAMTVEHQRWILSGRKTTTLRRRPLAPGVYRMAGKPPYPAAVLDRLTEGGGYVALPTISHGSVTVLPRPQRIDAPAWGGRRAAAMLKAGTVPFFPDFKSGKYVGHSPEAAARFRDEQWHDECRRLLAALLPGEGYGPDCGSEGSGRAAFLSLLDYWHPEWRFGAYPLYLHTLRPHEI
jgi:hypothetical protein